MKYFIASISPVIARLMLLVVVFTSFFGIFFCSQMMMSMGRANAMKSDCVGAMGANEDCAMSLTDHLSVWNGLLRGIVDGSVLSLIASLMAVAYFGIMRTIKENFAIDLFQKIKVYFHQHWRTKLHNIFVSLFAAGILQPKIFA